MKFSTLAVTCALWSGLQLASPSVAGAQTLASIWRDFYQGCAEDPEHRQLCACAATEFIQRCQAATSGSPLQVARCVERNQDAWLNPVVELCHGYGALHVAGPVATPTPQVVSGRGATTTQDAVWSTAYATCEPAMSAGVHHEYACACVASYVVQTCAPTSTVPASHVASCVPAMQSEIERVAPLCSQFGALAVTAAAPGAPPAAPQETSMHQGAVRHCNELQDLQNPTQRLECARVLTTVTSWDVDAFLRYLPLDGAVRLFRNAESSPAAVREHFARNGGLDVLFSHHRPRVEVIRGASPLLVLRDSDVADIPAPAAYFRWNAQTLTWELFSIDYPSE